MLSKIAKKNKERKMAGAAAAPEVDPAEERLKSDLLAELAVPARVWRSEESKRVVYASMTVDGGIWAGGEFHFTLRFSCDYPYEAPKVKYTGPRRLFHPNIEGDADKEEWGVCLGLFEQWRPSYGVADIVIALHELFYAPTAEDPLPGVSKTAALLLRENPDRFRHIAQQWMRGDYRLDI